MRIIPIKDFPLIARGDDLPHLIANSLEKVSHELVKNSVLVITHKIVSIAEGRLFRAAEIEPSERAINIARANDENPKRVELAIRESTDIIRETPVLITKTRSGIITDYSGIDRSNAPDGYYVGLPENPDMSAFEIHNAIFESLEVRIPVIISDTQGRPWRNGATNIAIGLYGMSPFIVNEGKSDLYGRRLHSSLVCIADELASAAELAMGQANERVPLVLITDVPFEFGSASSKEILRADDENLFL